MADPLHLPVRGPFFLEETMKEKLEIALGSLDPELDENWTSDGSPKLDVLSTFGKLFRSVVSIVSSFDNSHFIHLGASSHCIAEKTLHI